MLVPPPTLTISSSGGTLIFTWLASDYHFRLQSTTNLTNGAWSDVAATVTDANRLNQVAVPSPTGTVFYRLASSSI